MNRVYWIAVDERQPDGNPESIADLLSLSKGHVAAVALPLNLHADELLASAKRLVDGFGVAIVPVISEEVLKVRPEFVLECMCALAKEGLLTGGRGFPPAVLLRPARNIVIDGSLLISLREAVAPFGTLRVGWVNRLGTLTSMPVGFDFSVDWPPFSLSVSEEGAPFQQSDALDLAIDAARRHANDGALSLSAIVGSEPDGSYEIGNVKVTGLDTPIQQLWLDSAHRFASNRCGFGIPYVFLRLVGNRANPLPSWLPERLRSADRSSWNMPEPAQTLSAPIHRGAQPRIAAVIHLYYPDLWPEFRSVIEAIPEAVDVYVSTPLLIADAVRACVVRDCPDAVVFGTRNIGRDVLPFLHVLRSVGAERYRYVLKLHSKKSVHMDTDDNNQMLGGGEAWRRKSIEELSGCAQRVSDLLNLMDADERIGLIAPAGQLFRQDTWRCGTGNLVARLCAELGIPSEAETFGAGTMFWVRPAAIASLVSADSKLLDFEREAGQVDGTLHHAIERAFAHVAVAAGYCLVDTSDSSIRAHIA